MTSSRSSELTTRNIVVCVKKAMANHVRIFQFRYDHLDAFHAAHKNKRRQNIKQRLYAATCLFFRYPARECSNAFRNIRSELAHFNFFLWGGSQFSQNISLRSLEMYTSTVPSVMARLKLRTVLNDTSWRKIRKRKIKIIIKDLYVLFKITLILD